jgi:hypothetical protein
MAQTIIAAQQAQRVDIELLKTAINRLYMVHLKYSILYDVFILRAILGAIRHC